MKKLPLAQITGFSPENRSMLASEEYVLPRCLVGIEIEVECAHVLDAVNFDYWNVTEDDSLRNNGRELISPPLLGKDISNALTEVEYVFSEHSSLQFNERTSVHVHMDARDMDTEQLLALMMIYCIVERSLFRYCGQERAESIYCLPLYSAQGALHNITKICHYIEKEVPSGIQDQLNQYYKYQAINLRPIMAQGSIEFRHHAGCSNKAELMNWINLLMCIKKAALTFSAKDLPDLVSGHGGEAFLKSVFGEHAHLLINSFTQTDVFKGVRLAQDFIYTTALHEGVKKVKKCSYANSAYENIYIGAQPITEEQKIKQQFTWNTGYNFNEDINQL